MSEEIFNYDKSICAMLIKYIDGLGFLNNDDKANWLEIALTYKSNLDELYKLYDYINIEDKEFIDTKKLMKINKDGNLLEVSNENGICKIHKGDMKKIIASIIDILEEILPIGTVVELKNELVRNIYDSEKIAETPKFIIVKRFLSRDNNGAYFPYAAVPYPVGELNDGKNIHLTTKAIDKVIHKGFSDKTDLAYICVMKSELIFKKNMYSISFSSLDERQAYIGR